MLGFDYFGESQLAGTPLLDFLYRIKETSNISDATSKKLNYVISILEALSVDDNVSAIAISFLQVVERMTISDNTKLNFMIVILNAFKVYEHIWNIRNILIQEFAMISDSLYSLRSLIIKESMVLSDFLKVNGEIVVEFWRACLSKGSAVVTGIYKKFRR